LASGANADNPQAIETASTCENHADGACHNLCQTVAENDPDLAAIVTAWPALPEALKAGILAMVKASAKVEGK